MLLNKIFFKRLSKSRVDGLVDFCWPAWWADIEEKKVKVQALGEYPEEEFREDSPVSMGAGYGGFFEYFLPAFSS